MTPDEMPVQSCCKQGNPMVREAFLAQPLEDRIKILHASLASAIAALDVIELKVRKLYIHTHDANGVVVVPIKDWFISWDMRN